MIFFIFSAMKKQIILLLIGIVFFGPIQTRAQADPDEMGAWYMYVFSTRFKDSRWGIQGDIQHRNFNLLGDLQQLLLRGGFTYMPLNTPLKLTFGYAHITTGTQGPADDTIAESRFYQETSFPVKLAKRIYSNHRFRYELRNVDGQDFRTRYRYNLFLNIPLNSEIIVPKTLYLALYNEIFINGQRKIGDGKTVSFFDRNRLYGAFGYMIKEGLKMQFGLMRQTTNAFGKNQLQLSFHHSF